MASEPAVSSRKQFRALIVDDNRDAAETLAMLVNHWGFEVRTAYGGKEALDMADTFRPDCFVLDIAMPGMDGFELARRIRQRPDLPASRIIALTAYSGEDHLSRVREAGFDYHLTKPADPGELERLLCMLAQAIKLAERTEALAIQNVELAQETKELLIEVKDELKEVKHEIKEVREELREFRQEP
jgi:two-component system, OmpR family, response regulator